MAAVYVDEDEVWKCLKHPSKRRKSGICHVCLRERLAALCPDCANLRPCPCCATTSSDSSTSSSGDGVRVAKLIEAEPSFRRSRSVAVPFLRFGSRRAAAANLDLTFAAARSEPQSGRTKTPSFWSSVFRSSRRSHPSEAPPPSVKIFGEIEEVGEEEDDAEMRKRMMMRSRSVAVPMISSNSGSSGKPPSKGRSWYFPSPIKAFRHNKFSKIGTERSPVYRG